MASRLSGESDAKLPFAEHFWGGGDPSAHVKCPHSNAVYASEACRDAAWRMHHQALCPDAAQAAALDALRQQWRELRQPADGDGQLTTHLELLLRILAAETAAVLDQPEPDGAAEERSGAQPRPRPPPGEVVQPLWAAAKEQLATGSADTLPDVLGPGYERERESIRAALLAFFRDKALSPRALSWLAPEGFTAMLAMLSRRSTRVATSSYQMYVDAIYQIGLPPNLLDQFDSVLTALNAKFKKFGTGDPRKPPQIYATGSGLYPWHTSCRHSCAPNAAVVYPDNCATAYIVALEPIAPGDEVFVSRLDDEMLRRRLRVKRAALAAQCLPNCPCSPCMAEEAEDTTRVPTVVIVGAGASGIGMAALLRQCDIDHVVLERGRVGESFLTWPKETRFISPSFTGNFFGSVDLNAITPDSSPAFSLQTQHPSGPEYAAYLRGVVEHYDLDVRTGVTVHSITGMAEPGSAAAKQLSEISVVTSAGTFTPQFVVWAGGEFQFPNHIPNTVRVTGGESYARLPKGNHVIIGGNESGMDAAWYLATTGNHVTVLDDSAPWAQRNSDSSYGLSPKTLDRVREMKSMSDRVAFVAERATTIEADQVCTASRSFPLSHPALDATGFDITQSLAGGLFEFDGGSPKLTANDESTAHANVFMAGPMVKHDKAVFCFIYKYRQRWAVIADEILSRMDALTDAENHPLRLAAVAKAAVEAAVPAPVVAKNAWPVGLLRAEDEGSGAAPSPVAVAAPKPSAPVRTPAPAPTLAPDAHAAADPPQTHDDHSACSHTHSHGHDHSHSHDHSHRPGAQRGSLPRAMRMPQPTVGELDVGMAVKAYAGSADGAGVDATLEVDQTITLAPPRAGILQNFLDEGMVQVIVSATGELITVPLALVRAMGPPARGEEMKRTVIAEYRKKGFMLDDLSCCADECAC